LTFREFLAARRSRRFAAKAHRAMLKAYGAAFERNASGIVDLLTSPAPVIVLDPAQLDEVVRRAVAEAVASFEPASTDGPVVYAPPEEVWQESAPATEELPVEPPRDTSIFAEPVGNGNPPPAQPVQPARVQPTSADDLRREFVRNFLQDQRAARGVGITS